MRIKSRSWTNLFLLLILLAACQPATPADRDSIPTPVENEVTGNQTVSVPGDGAEPIDVPVAESGIGREREPQVTEEALAGLSEGNRHFSFDLFQALRSEEGNLFFSPYSISASLAMTYAGAGGEAAQQMAKTLHFELPEEELHAAFNALELHLTTAGPSTDEEESFRLAVANSLWAQEGFPMEQSFLDLLARHHGAGLRLVDYLSDAGREAARQAINIWVERQTEGKIQDLIAENVLTADTRLVLANAIYFLGKWVEPFVEAGEQPFTLLGGEQVNAPMMSRRTSTAYDQGNGYQALALDYKDSGARMILLVPDPSQYEVFEASLDQERFEQIVAGLEATDVALTMPRFEFESEFGLKKTLEEMGMTAAFDRRAADFSGMSAEFGRQLYLSTVIHKAFVAVDEEGTEAAAATAEVVNIVSEPSVSLTIDRPFLLAIQDAETGAIPFFGRVLDPTSG